MSALQIVWADTRNPRENELMAQWCSARVKDQVRPHSFGKCVTMGVLTDKLIAVVVFNNWSPDSDTMELSAASIDPRWLTRRTLLAMYGYTFDVVRCQMVYQRVSCHNTRMVSIFRRFGMGEIVIPRMRGRNEDEYLFTLTKEQWRKKAKELTHER